MDNKDKKSNFDGVNLPEIGEMEHRFENNLPGIGETELPDLEKMEHRFKDKDNRETNTIGGYKRRTKRSKQTKRSKRSKRTKKNRSRR
jgi:hypothetical protein